MFIPVNLSIFTARAFLISKFTFSLKVHLVPKGKKIHAKWTINRFNVWQNMDISIPSSSIICFIWHKEHQQPKNFQSAIHPLNLALKYFHSLMRKGGPNLQSCRIYQSTATTLDFPHALSGCMKFNRFASQKSGVPFVPGVPARRKACVGGTFGLHFSLVLRMGVTPWGAGTRREKCLNQGLYVQICVLWNISVNHLCRSIDHHVPLPMFFTPSFKSMSD